MSSQHYKKKHHYETPLVKLSKSLSYVLRHHAKDEGLDIREDGYVKLDDLQEKTGKQSG
ncbi:12842_t:CDS:2 [Racocetra fulgida]|uniref:2'-phosphotransferase n=1 Tax=Racocetra fulgida TaxID=60492 RepID=A0A9N9AEE8_9GLOM|nr:12842_t:CDS:2 [Racocetra fulgida]